MKKTKIVCTLGPTSDTKEKISAMYDAGMNVCRLNFSHGTHEEHLKKINAIKELRKERKIPLPIMLDTKGLRHFGFQHRQFQSSFSAK